MKSLCGARRSVSIFVFKHKHVITIMILRSHGKRVESPVRALRQLHFQHLILLVFGNASPQKPARRLLGAFQQWNSVLEGKEKEKGGKASKKFLRPWEGKGKERKGKEEGVKHTL
jgi:hypothetical protein